nr:MAG: hypothetical protein DIU70_08220 [Bacillota bacterium]
MGFRFRKSMRLAPGVRLNIGKRSIGISAGPGTRGGPARSGRRSMPSTRKRPASRSAWASRGADPLPGCRGTPGKGAAWGVPPPVRPLLQPCSRGGCPCGSRPPSLTPDPRRATFVMI